jgi:hypothetical protein
MTTGHERGAVRQRTFLVPNCKNTVKLPLKRVGAIADSPPHCENLDHSPSEQGEVMPTVETRLRQELRSCAVELRQLAYTLPHGVGEHALLQLSDRMHTAADQAVRKGA